MLERIANEVIGDVKQFIFQHSDNLSFYLVMRQVYLDHYVGQLKDLEHIYKY